MARLTAVMLCDFAQVRENLLFVSSAGISRLFQPSLPVRPPLYVAGIAEIDPDGFAAAHEIHIRVRLADEATELGEAVLSMPSLELSPVMKPGESATLPFALPLGPLELPAFGAYDVSVSIDGEPSVMLTLYLEQMPGEPED